MGALRGCRETRYWLELLHETGYITDGMYAGLSADCRELLGLLSAVEQGEAEREIAT
jgi:four helix bundle protein